MKGNTAERLKKRLDEEDKREHFLLRPFHSHFYHRQFEGYTEYKRPNEKGKMKIVRVYTGQYYRPDLSIGHRRLLRAVYLVLFLIMLGCFIVGASLDTEVNYNIYTNIIIAATVPAAFWMAIALVNYLAAPEKLKIPEYKSGPVRLKTASMVCFVLSLMRFLSLALYCLCIKGALTSGDLTAMIYALICAAAMILINRIENKVVYESVINPVKPERDGIEIQ